MTGNFVLGSGGSVNQIDQWVYSAGNWAKYSIKDGVLLETASPELTAKLNGIREIRIEKMALFEKAVIPSLDDLRVEFSDEPEPMLTLSEDRHINHLIQEGDTLSIIAEKYNSTVQAIIELNDISDPNLVIVGNNLIIPSRLSSSYIVKKGDSLWNLALDNGFTVEQLIAANPWLEDEGRISENGEYVLLKVGEGLKFPDIGDEVPSGEDGEAGAGEDEGGDELPDNGGEIDNFGWNDPQGKAKDDDNLRQGKDKFARATDFRALCDPLIIDLNGDGLALNGWANSGVNFDLNDDGLAEESGWTLAGSDDAFLAIDKNNNGNIDDINELFGNQITAGFAELAQYDSNHDQLINAADSQFELLKIWQDLDADGIVDTGELKSLAEHNIESISLES